MLFIYYKFNLIYFYKICSKGDLFFYSGMIISALIIFIFKKEEKD